MFGPALVPAMLPDMPGLLRLQAAPAQPRQRLTTPHCPAQPLTALTTAPTVSPKHTPPLACLLPRGALASNSEHPQTCQWGTGWRPSDRALHVPQQGWGPAQERPRFQKTVLHDLDTPDRLAGRWCGVMVVVVSGDAQKGHGWIRLTPRPFSGLCQMVL